MRATADFDKSSDAASSIGAGDRDNHTRADLARRSARRAPDELDLKRRKRFHELADAAADYLEFRRGYGFSARDFITLTLTDVGRDFEFVRISLDDAGELVIEKQYARRSRRRGE